MLDKKHRIWYDAATLQIVGYDVDITGDRLASFPGSQIKDVDDTALAAMMGKSPYNFLYDSEIDMAIPKPKFVLIPDKSEADVGGDIITVRVELRDITGNVLPWSSVKIKDISGKAQISCDTVDYATRVFKVRSFVPGVAEINVKEVWDGVTRIRCTGGQFFKYAQADILKLKFVNKGF